ncbi:MAG TPA: MFS transporter [Gammaproteobacteria bacterium]|nr:MFS transporter [Gammaproteobacteria bacterium]
MRSPTDAAASAIADRTHRAGTAFPVLGAISFSHLLNDMMQSLIVAIYPLLKGDFGLTFIQIGLITLTYQIAGSLLQPLVGHVTDKKPLPYSLPTGMGFTCCGLLLLANAPNFAMLLLAAALIGTGSSIFHPESSRVARMASGKRPGLAQSVFMVGGNFGSSIGPLLAAWIVIPHGRGAVEWFSLAALAGFIVLLQVGRWYGRNYSTRGKAHLRERPAHAPTRRRAQLALLVLGVLIFSKYFYLASITSYYTFYLMHTFNVSVQNAEVHLFIFMASVACGVMIGGPIGDRIGRKWVIWISILGVAPFTLLLPHANLFWTGVLSAVIGLILSSAFPAIIVYAQELVPTRIGMISGLFYGLAFGMGGIGAAVLGHIADLEGIGFVYRICAYLPLLGIFAAFLPNLKAAHQRA